jgi:c-di-GMP-binding flagellar brake protein YcgR
MAFLPVSKGELGVGKPLPWPLYDQNQRVLLPDGSVIETEHHLDILADVGLYRDPEWRAASADTPSGAETAPASDQKHYRLDDLKLPVGDNLQLQTRSKSGSRYYAKVIGYVKGQGLVVSTPTQDGKVLLMHEGEEFIVRVFAGESAFAFGTRVTHVYNLPYPHLHLSYPTEITGVRVRKSPRVNTCLFAAVSSGKGQDAPGMIVNLSTTGALLHARTELGHKDEDVTIGFRMAMNGMELALKLPAKLRSIFRKESGSSNIHHGVEFRGLADNDKLALQAYVYWCLLENQADG